MSRTLAKTITHTLTWTDEQRELIRNTMAPNLDDQEFAVYMEAARKMQLDPLTKQIYVFSQGGGKDKRLNIAPTIDGYWAIAQRNGPLLPISEDFATIDGELVCTVRGRVRMCGEWVDVSQRAYYEEQNRGGPIWKGKPRIMLAKCAWARLIRKLFPEDLSGTTIPEEVGDGSGRITAPPAKIEGETDWDGQSAIAELATELHDTVEDYARLTGDDPKKAWKKIFTAITGKKRAADATPEDCMRLREEWEKYIVCDEEPKQGELV